MWPEDDDRRAVGREIGIKSGIVAIEAPVAQTLFEAHLLGARLRVRQDLPRIALGVQFAL